MLCSVVLDKYARQHALRTSNYWLQAATEGATEAQFRRDKLGQKERHNRKAQCSDVNSVVSLVHDSVTESSQ